MTGPQDAASFDAYATSYHAELDKALSVSGETAAFFARERVRWLAGRLERHGRLIRRAMDFGCGTGSSAPLILEALGADSILGVDTSSALLEAARRDHESPQVSFVATEQYAPQGEMDLVYCNGVFHHIPESGRPGAVEYIRRALRPGGLFALWENNPWNPGTRYIMRRTPFDRDARTLSPPQARRLLKDGGFQPLETTFRFIFPHLLRCLRFLEPRLARAPLGGQYQVLAIKPS